MNIAYPEVGVCGLSCRLCPSYHAHGESRCGGCKSVGRMSAGCPFITCAVKKRGIEFCWQCEEQDVCRKWELHRASGKQRDSFVCYQALEANIATVLERGIEAFVTEQQAKERVFRTMLSEYNDGRSKTFYSIAVTVMTQAELEYALDVAGEQSAGVDLKMMAKCLHTILDEIALKKGYALKLRK